MRVAVGKRGSALLVPEKALGTEQGGHDLLTVNAKDVVEQHSVKLGPSVGAMRVIEEGIGADDRVVVSGTQRAIPGAKVAPQPAGAKAAPEQTAAKAPAAVSDATATPSADNGEAAGAQAPAKH
ncbi:MAG: hypothetical protein L0H73_02955 [Nitrococcus sp.]|nr:hypothetical protein [Nitrococcus sp.]